MATVGNSFNQPVDNLPNSVTHATFGDDFNQSVDNLPNNLIELALTSTCQIKNSIPENIEKNKILFHNRDKNNYTIKNIPYHIKEIKINNKNKIYYLQKIPFECKVVDEQDNEVFI